ncbi:AAA family ATPase [uncultured Parabacteroides sp.]|uniref:AAA family ATPase n=1 Tax=uncultured Parabacteroides sp. TaxID=512312 RepID=UPI0026585CE6|nr:AAA family ATPase [uncultured Parabacteroides sp.]
MLHNYRAYKGHNKTSFKPDTKNIFLVAGNNGFGKTTFLTSLVWCLYGKLMADVDEKFRRDINDAQGYKNYARQSLHKELANAVNAYEVSLEERKQIIKYGYSSESECIKEDSQYYVEISLTDVFIPSIPCRTITIRRTYDYFLDIESVEVLIDGQVNELAKEVGYDIFINDFILSKDIAKFFFFDAEKIVNLAEVKSIDEKRRLSTAYSEVLGIKKYEDIKRNLENLRLKFRRNAGSTASKAKLDKLTSSVADIEVKIKAKEAERENVDSQIQQYRTESVQLQERLIREGNAISVEELKRQKELLVALKDKDTKLKNQLRDMLDIAPFAISGRLFANLMRQVAAEKDVKTSAASCEAINSALQSTHTQITDVVATLKFSTSQKQAIEHIIAEVFAKNILDISDATIDGVKILVDYTDNEANEFQALFDNVRYSFSGIFKQLVKDIKNNALFLAKTQRKIVEAEYDDGNANVKEIRMRKSEVDELLTQLDIQTRQLSEQIGTFNKDIKVLKKQLSEVAKNVRVDKSDKEKDFIAERLIGELTTFLFELRTKRKLSLEKKIMAGIDVLMHKADFIHNVRIDLQDDIIEIELLDKTGEIISKEKLSKGEQQLYATAILNALVEESGIEFPVFIDSPLQKFDSIHSRNIITKFYPNVSKQVVIFPLLGKELSKDEYNALLPNVNRVYVIENEDGCSSFKKIVPNKLFETLS